MKVVIPVFPFAVGTTVIGIRDMLVLTQGFIEMLPEEVKQGIKEKPWFNVVLASTNGEKEVNCLGVKISTDIQISEVDECDVIIIPALVGKPEDWFYFGKNFISWLKERSLDNTTICSTCTGSFFLAEAGLLHNRRATTSWFMADFFRKMYPDIDLADSKLLVESDNVITSGATMSYQQLCVYLIDKTFGNGLSSYVAKIYLVEKGNQSQTKFSVLVSGQHLEDNFVHQIHQHLETELATNIDIEKIADLVSMSTRSLSRKFKAATGLTISDYYLRLKVEKAKAQLENSTMSIKEISYGLGYNDLTSFRQIFKRFTGITPKEYLARFSYQMRP